MTLKEWQAYYEKKTGMPVEEKPYATTLFDEKLGFMAYFVKGDQFIVFETAGNGKHWQRVAVELARQLGCKELFTTIYVDPKIYQRRFPETKVFGTIMKQEVD